jgi:hypothetical protein
MNAPNWIDEEPPLRPALGRLLVRLFRRGAVTWWLWIPVAALVALGAAAFKHRHRVFDATVVLRVTEGTVRVPGAELGAGALRAQVEDLAFTNPNLASVLKRHVVDFPDVTTDPVDAVTDLRRSVDVVITDNDFVEERAADDPPRSAGIALSFRSPNPELALAVVRDLAELVVRSALNQQRQALERAGAAAATAVRQAEAQSARAADDAELPALAAQDPRAEAARQRLIATVAKATDARLGQRAGEAQQTLHIDLVDAGRVPRRPTRLEQLEGFALVLALAALACWLVAGAFDPRVLGRDDLIIMDLAPLGEVPALPAARSRGGEMPDA